MAITITVDKVAADKLLQKQEKKVQAKAYLQARRTLDGSILIFDHPDIDIAVLPKKDKIIAFAKDEMGDHIYASQSRLFDFLKAKGIVEFDSIRGGNVFASLEATIPKNETLDTTQAAIFTIGKFIEEERPYYKHADEYEEEVERDLLEPTEEESTELGEIPHEPRKGAISRFPGTNVAYGLTGMYRA